MKGVWRSEEAQFSPDFSDHWNIFRGDISCLPKPKVGNAGTLFKFALNQNATFLKIKHLCELLVALFEKSHFMFKIVVKLSNKKQTTIVLTTPLL